jgi:arsenite methyltransferase
MKKYLLHRNDFSRPEIASVVDELSFWSSRFGRLLFDNIGIRRDIKILDLACGVGFPLFEMAHVFGESCHITGIDIWKEGLNRARWKQSVYNLSNVTIVEADGAKQPFRDSEFDLIVSNLGINNFSDPQAVVTETFRVAKPGAAIVLTTNMNGHMKEFYDLYREILTGLNKRDYLERLRKNYEHRRTKETISDLLERAGFIVVKVVEDSFVMRYQDGSALFNHSLTKIGFLDGWKSVVDPEDVPGIFEKLEERLNEIAVKNGELRMTVPMLYIEGKKPE